MLWQISLHALSNKVYASLYILITMVMWYYFTMLATTKPEVLCILSRRKCQTTSTTKLMYKLMYPHIYQQCEICLVYTLYVYTTVFRARMSHNLTPIQPISPSHMALQMVICTYATVSCQKGFLSDYLFSSCQILYNYSSNRGKFGVAISGPQNIAYKFLASCQLM